MTEKSVTQRVNVNDLKSLRALASLNKRSVPDQISFMVDSAVAKEKKKWGTAWKRILAANAKKFKRSKGGV